MKEKIHSILKRLVDDKEYLTIRTECENNKFMDLESKIISFNELSIIITHYISYNIYTLLKFNRTDMQSVKISIGDDYLQIKEIDPEDEVSKEILNFIKILYNSTNNNSSIKANKFNFMKKLDMEFNSLDENITHLKHLELNKQLKNSRLPKYLLPVIMGLHPLPKSDQDE